MRSKMPRRPRSPRFMASPWATVRCRSWQGGNPGDPARLAALVEGCGLRARPLRQARGWGYQRLSALGTIIVVDAAPPPPPRMAATRLRLDAGDGNERRRAAAGRQLRRARAGADRRCRTSWSRRCARTAAHSTLIARRHQFDRDPARRQPRQGRDRRRRSSAARTMTARGSRPATTAMSRASA